jgi:hypothetical protein
MLCRRECYWRVISGLSGELIIVMRLQYQSYKNNALDVIVAGDYNTTLSG